MVPRGKLRYAVGERGKHSTRARAPDRNRNRRRTRLEQQQERRQKSQSNPWNPCRLGRLEALSWAEGNPCLKISQIPRRYRTTRRSSLQNENSQGTRVPWLLRMAT